MTLYLLDTNILSDLLKNPQGIVAQRLNKHSQKNLCTSIIVAAEMRYGAEKKNIDLLTKRVQLLLDTITVFPFSSNADLWYGRIRSQLEKSGQIIGANDLLIAAHALSLNAVLVTGNVNEFRRITDLSVENWLTPTK